MARNPRLRHLKKSTYNSRRRSRRLRKFVDLIATNLDTTGASKNFTLNLATATATLTMSGVPVEDEIIQIDEQIYTYKDALTEAVASGILTGTTIADTNTVTIGAKTYTFKTALTEAKAVNSLDVTTILDTNTVTIDSTVYRFVDTLAQAFDVLIEVAVTDSLDNLIAAINAGAGSGTKYHVGTTIHPTVTAAAGTGDTVDVTAKSVGVAANSIATTDTLSVGAWDTATLTGGVDAIVNEILVGASDSDSLDNLIAAINGDAGEGTTFATGTIAHTQVTATAGAGDTIDLVYSPGIGTAGNSVVTTSTLTAGGFGAATLTGGVNAIINEILIAGSAELTIDNLVAAVTGDTGEGTTYSTGTVAETNTITAKESASTVSVTALVTGSVGNDIVATTDAVDSDFDTAGTLEGGLDSGNLTSSSHGYNVGDGPFIVSSSGTIPVGLLGETLYWISQKPDSNTFVLTSDRYKNIAQVITAVGSGTYTITKAEDADAIFELLKTYPPSVLRAENDVDDL